jgi:hypothetical protein
MNTRLEFEIVEAFQKTEYYKTVTKGLDVFPAFRDGYLAYAARPTECKSENSYSEEKKSVHDFLKIPKADGNTMHGMGFR